MHIVEQVRVSRERADVDSDKPCNAWIVGPPPREPGQGGFICRDSQGHIHHGHMVESEGRWVFELSDNGVTWEFGRIAYHIPEPAFIAPKICPSLIEQCRADPRAKEASEHEAFAAFQKHMFGPGPQVSFDLHDWGNYLGGWEDRGEKTLFVSSRLASAVESAPLTAVGRIDSMSLDELGKLIADTYDCDGTWDSTDEHDDWRRAARAVRDRMAQEFAHVR